MVKWLINLQLWRIFSVLAAICLVSSSNIRSHRQFILYFIYLYCEAYLHNTFKLEGESSKWHKLISYDFCKFKEKHFVFPFVTFATFVRQNLPCDKLGGSLPYEGQFNFIHRNILYQKLQLLILACNDTIKILQCYLFLYKSINVMFKL